MEKNAEKFNLCNETYEAMIEDLNINEYFNENEINDIQGYSEEISNFDSIVASVLDDESISSTAEVNQMDQQEVILISIDSIFKSQVGEEPRILNENDEKTEFILINIDSMGAITADNVDSIKLSIDDNEIHKEQAYHDIDSIIVSQLEGETFNYATISNNEISDLEKEVCREEFELSEYFLNKNEIVEEPEYTDEMLDIDKVLMAHIQEETSEAYQELIDDLDIMRYFVGDNNINGEHEFSDGNELIESLVLSKIENEDIPSISINHNEISISDDQREEIEQMSHTEHFVDGIKFTEKRSYSDEMINIDSIMISQIVDEALNGIPTNFNDMSNFFDDFCDKMTDVLNSPSEFLDENEKDQRQEYSNEIIDFDLIVASEMADEKLRNIISSENETSKFVNETYYTTIEEEKIFKVFDNEEKTKKYLECRDKIGILDSTVLPVIEDDTINYTNEKTKLGNLEFEAINIEDTKEAKIYVEQNEIFSEKINNINKSAKTAAINDTKNCIPLCNSSTEISKSNEESPNIAKELATEIETYEIRRNSDKKVTTELNESSVMENKTIKCITNQKNKPEGEEKCLKHDAKSTTKNRQKKIKNESMDTPMLDENATEIKQKKFACHLCCYETKQKKNLRCHMDSIHLDLKPFKCNLCKFACNLRSALQSHINCIHLNLRQHKCQLCEFTASRKGNLKEHINSVHLNLKKHKCPLCDHSANRESDLNRHIDSFHLNLKKHKCDFCDYGATRKSDLLKHVDSVHTSLKKHKCNLCDFAASVKDNLRRHVNAIHLKLKQHKCHLCDYASCQNNDLKKHIDCIHGNKKKKKRKNKYENNTD